jgi:hypothetical protein
MIRTPFALEKMTYDKNTGMVLYRSKFHATLKRNFDPPHPCGGPCGRTTCVQFRSRRNCQLLPATQWLKLLLAQIPDKYEHLVCYYGWYSNRTRGERHAAAGATGNVTTLYLDETPADRQSRAHWARLIQKVSALASCFALPRPSLDSYEVDPLACPKCGSTMRIIAVIDDPAVIRQILKHLRLWNPHPKASEHAARASALADEYHPPPDLPSRSRHRLKRRNTAPFVRRTRAPASMAGNPAQRPFPGRIR